MKIFTDTNVLVSALTARGLCADLFEVILADHQLIIGEVVLEELERVLLLKLKVPEKDALQTLQFLRKQHIQPLPDSVSELNIRDEDDRWILESAIQAKADILVTGDKDLLVVAEQVMQLKIISPRQFWDLLKE